MATIDRPVMKMLASVACAVLVQFAGSSASAQYQAIFGGNEYDEGTGGIVQADDGNFVAVGIASSFGPDDDIYVVKSDLCGNLIWARTYDIGGNEVSGKIRLAKDGGFIIAGTTANLNTCCVLEEGFSFEDGFLLKITAKGEVEWAKTYGGQDHDHLFDIQRVPNSDGFYVVGKTASFGAGRYDGWLMEVTATGRMVWSRTYGEWSRDGLYSLAVAKDSTIIAVGETVSYSQPGRQDMFVVKVSGLDGAPIWASYYRPPTSAFARTIMLDAAAPGGGAFYIGGIISSVTGGSDGYIMKGNYTTGGTIADLALHQTGGSNSDEITEIIKLPNGNLLAVGAIGPSMPPPVTNYDAFMVELSPLLVTIWQRAYGGNSNDQGWAAAVGVQPFSSTYTLMMLGYTSSFGVTGRNMYQVYTASNGVSGCNERIPSITRLQPGSTGTAIQTHWAKVWVECPAKPVVSKNTLGRVLCNNCYTPTEEASGELSRAGAPGADDSEGLGDISLIEPMKVLVR